MRVVSAVMRVVSVHSRRPHAAAQRAQRAQRAHRKRGSPFRVRTRRLAQPKRVCGPSGVRSSNHRCFRNHRSWHLRCRARMGGWLLWRR
jgi:hypothetical protein